MKGANARSHTEPPRVRVRLTRVAGSFFTEGSVETRTRSGFAMSTSAEPVSKKPKLGDGGGEGGMDVDGKENSAKKVALAGKATYAEGDTHDLMPLYYKHLFPAETMMSWLAYGNDSKKPGADQGFMQRREFCFTLEGDVFARYQSFKNATDLRTALRNKVPTKIDLGPVFNVDPTKRAAYSGSSGGGGTVFAPVERELVMDIDMTDYDDVRTCCSAANICNKCWPLMTIAVKVIDAGLRQDFGFKHLLWVYSGRRGIHVWVCDKRARFLSNESRAAVAEYFSVYKGTDASGTTKRVNLTGTALRVSQIQAHCFTPCVTTLVIEWTYTTYITSALFAHTVRLKTDPFLSQSQSLCTPRCAEPTMTCCGRTSLIRSCRTRTFLLIRKR